MSSLYPELLESNGANYSQTKIIHNHAEDVYLNTKRFLENTAALIKEQPLLDQNDSAYQHYLSYNQAKMEIKKRKRSFIFKIILVVVFVLFFVIAGIYLLFFKGYKGRVDDTNSLIGEIGA